MSEETPQYWDTITELGGGYHGYVEAHDDALETMDSTMVNLHRLKAGIETAIEMNWDTATLYIMEDSPVIIEGRRDRDELDVGIAPILPEDHPANPDEEETDDA